jgi:hypothetical protein
MSNLTVSDEGAGTYDILFVGLACFLKTKRLVLFPDGRTPQKGITPHTPFIVVDPVSVEDNTEWQTNDADQTALMKRGLYTLPTCELTISGASTQGTLNAQQHDRFVPKLIAADPKAVIDPAKANAVVRFELGSGTLEALRTPEAEPGDDDVAIISRLRVDHADPITIDVSDKEAGTCRKLKLKPGTGIALANIAFGDDGMGGDHFAIYGELTKTGRINGRPQPTAPNVEQLRPDHYIFSLGLLIQDGGSPCGNQGCCPP